MMIRISLNPEIGDEFSVVAHIFARAGTHYNLLYTYSIQHIDEATFHLAFAVVE